MTPVTESRALRLAGVLTRATEAIGALIMLAIVVVNVLQVFFRYVLADPLGWTEEVMRYSVIWMTFLVAGAALFRGEQLSIDMLGGFIPPRLRRLQSIVILLAIATFCLVLVVWGLPLALRNAAQLSPSAQIPMIVPSISVVVGALLILVKAICLIVAAPETVLGAPEGTGAVESSGESAGDGR